MPNSSSSEKKTVMRPLRVEGRWGWSSNPATWTCRSEARPPRSILEYSPSFLRNGRQLCIGCSLQIQKHENVTAKLVYPLSRALSLAMTSRWDIRLAPAALWISAWPNGCKVLSNDFRNYNKSTPFRLPYNILTTVTVSSFSDAI